MCVRVAPLQPSPRWLNWHSSSLVNYHFSVRLRGVAPFLLHLPVSSLSPKQVLVIGRCQFDPGREDHFMPYIDKERQREYSRNWVANRRALYFKDKVCTKCGGTDRLELDHIDPVLKVSHNIWSWSEIRQRAELVKCQILCFKCHKAKTLMLYAPKRHGTDAMYHKGPCKCELCLKAHADYLAGWRIRTGKH